MTTHNITSAYLASFITDGAPTPTMMNLNGSGVIGNTYTLSASATTTLIQVTDDDGYLQDDNPTDPTPGDNTQSEDLSQEVLANVVGSNNIGTDVFSRLTYTVSVTDSVTGDTYLTEMSQIRMADSTSYWAFQTPVPAGSTFTVTDVAQGDTLYSDLDTSDDVIDTYEMNQVINQAQFDALLTSGSQTYANTDADIKSMFVIDNDARLQDNVNSGLQTFDQNMQNLAASIDGIPEGAYVLSRAYYTVQNDTTGEIGRLYQIRVVTDMDYDGTTTPGNDWATVNYYAYSDDFLIKDGDTISLLDTNLTSSTGDVDFADLYAVCYLRGTLIDTPSGQKPVESLAAGDLILTGDGAAKPIRWIGGQTFQRKAVTAKPQLAPVKISAGCLGENIPERDLYVSQQHRILVQSRVAGRMFGNEEVLVPAKSLLKIEGVSVVTNFDEVEYFHFMFDDHALVRANGLMSESLFTGKEALRAVGDEAKEEIFTIFPELRDSEILRSKPSVRPILTRRKGESLIARHIKNRQKIQMGRSLH